MNKTLLVIFSFFFSPFVFALTAHEVMTKNEEVRKIKEVVSDATLATGGSGVERTKQFTWWRKLTPDQLRFNTLTRFNLPAEVRGEKILFLEKSSDENEILMYLPNFKKIRRVESQQQSGSFMGSEFSYSDIATPHVNDYRHKMLKEEPCPDEEKLKCHVIESIPISDSVRERTGYSKSVNWIRQDNYMGVRAEYTDLEGKLWKKLEASEIKLVDSDKNKWMSHRLRIENVKTGRFTLLQFTKVKVNQGIHDSIFTQQNLSRGN
jgi:uncharacterized protein